MIALDELRAIVGDAHVLTGGQQALDPAIAGARAIVLPGSPAEVAQVVAACARAHQCIVPHGGLTGLVGGADADETAIALSLRRLSRIEAIDRVDRTALVQAGVTVQQLQEAVDAGKLSFAVDFGARGSATIGGAIATNAGGNRVFRFGSMRQQVLGLEVVLADGTVVDSLKGLIKDNSGYDLNQVFIGSEGTLGIVTRACIRLRPRPSSCSTALVALESFDCAAALLDRLETELGGQLCAFEAMWQSFFAVVAGRAKDTALSPSHPFYILLEAQGAQDEADAARFEDVLMTAMSDGLFVDAVIAKSERERQALWAMREDLEGLRRQGAYIHFDVSLPLSAMAGYVAEVEADMRQVCPGAVCFCFGHVADGNLHLTVSRPEPFAAQEEARIKEAVYRPLAPLRGSISAEHGIGLDKRAYLPLSRSEEELHCMRLIKRALDPDNLLNPGKIFVSP